MPAIDTSTANEYHSVKNGFAIIDRSTLGQLTMAGSDSLDLLQRLSTQDLHILESGSGCLTVLTSEKGRVIDLLAVHHLGDKLLLVTSPGNQSAVANWLEKYTIIEDSITRDVTSKSAALAFFGAQATTFARRLAGDQLDSVAPWGHVRLNLMGTEVILAEAREPSGRGYHLLLSDSSHLNSLLGFLMELGQDLGIQSIGIAAYDMLRIESGLPEFGREMDERYNPLEIGLGSFISFSKGCYIGQEVVARLDTYNKVQKQLMGLLLPEGQLAPPGSKLLAEGRAIGMITSVTLTPRIASPIALGYVRSNFAEPGLLVELEDGNKATVVALPFN